MGKIIYIMGKSASGKDTVYKRLCGLYGDRLLSIATYTTRPKRDNEVQGLEYNFVDEDEYKRLRQADKVIEQRAYSTIHGQWIYFTVDDDQIAKVREGKNAIMVGTLESFSSLRSYLGFESVIPIYLELDDGLRLSRALEREMVQARPRYSELCRRYLADCEDFSEEKLYAAGITKRYNNSDLEECIKQCREVIDREINS